MARRISSSPYQRYAKAPYKYSTEYAEWRSTGRGDAHDRKFLIYSHAWRRREEDERRYPQAPRA